MNAAKEASLKTFVRERWAQKFGEETASKTETASSAAAASTFSSARSSSSAASPSSSVTAGGDAPFSDVEMIPVETKTAKAERKLGNVELKEGEEKGKQKQEDE